MTSSFGTCQCETPDCKVDVVAGPSTKPRTRGSSTLSNDSSGFNTERSNSLDPSVVKWVVLGMLGLLIAGFLTFWSLSKPVAPPPPDVAADPLLLEGRSIYLARCATCHGLEGRGDGPIAAYLLGPPVGNISDGKWKHGDKPQEVMAVISKGVEGTRMAPWDQVLEPTQIRAVTAYVFYLARQPVPEVLRQFSTH